VLRSVDLAIVSGEAARFGGTLTHLFDDELLFIMPPGHRLAGRHAVEGPDIVGEDFITYTKVPEPDREYARLFRPSGSYPNWTETVELPEAIVELVAAGLGISVLAGWAVRGAIAAGRVVTARVGGDGLSVAWFAAIRPADAEAGGAIAEVARLLSDWCASPGGGFGTAGDGSCAALRSSASA
jgi:LysR family transcriptional regulator for metE and metH